MRVCLGAVLVVFCIGTRADIVDRIAASVGHEVITESQVTDQIRVTAFIEGVAPDFGPENKRKVLERLIDQTLVRREVEFTRFQNTGRGRSCAVVEATGATIPEEGSKYGITEKQVMAQLTWQLTLLQFIEYRFQPAVQVTNAETRQEYRRQANAWREKNKTEPPPLEQIRADIEKIVRQRLTDSALDRWLAKCGPRTRYSIARAINDADGDDASS